MTTGTAAVAVGAAAVVAVAAMMTARATATAMVTTGATVATAVWTAAAAVGMAEGMVGGWCWGQRGGVAGIKEMKKPENMARDDRLWTTPGDKRRGKGGALGACHILFWFL